MSSRGVGTTPSKFMNSVTKGCAATRNSLGNEVVVTRTGRWLCCERDKINAPLKCCKERLTPISENL